VRDDVRVSVDGVAHRVRVVGGDLPEFDRAVVVSHPREQSERGRRELPGDIRNPRVFGELDAELCRDHR
jgi:hypothetical protein